MLALASGLTLGAEEDFPAHIVQPLPKELDPRSAPAFTAPDHIVRPFTAEEQARLTADAAPLDAAAFRKSGQDAIAANAADDAAVDQLIGEFRADHHVDINATPADSHPATPAQAEPAKAPADDADIYQIDCADGVFFDMEQGLLVYMKNVSLSHPRISLQCEGPLKIYLDQKEKKAPTAKKEAKDNDPVMPNGGNFDFDSLKKASASGKVVIKYKDANGAVSTAKADKVTYDAKTGEIILAGDYPTIQSDGHSVRCPSQNGFIRIYGNGNIYISEGAHTTIRDVDKQLSNKEKPKTTR